MAAFGIYLVLALVVFGRPLLGHFRDYYIATTFSPLGNGNPSAMMLYLSWWPFAISHGLNPFYTYSLWAPVGFNMMWATSLPLPGILLWPLTTRFGPVAAFNVLSLLSPPLAAWAAFLLCRYISKSWWPALLGGYLFGFSSYMLNEESSGDRHLTLVFLAPLAALAVIKAIRDGRCSGDKFISIIAAILAAQFLISTEVFATMSLFGAITLILCWTLSSTAVKPRIVKIGIWTCCAYLLAAAVLSPCIYWLFARGWPHGEVHAHLAENASADLIAFVIAPGATLLGSLPPFGALWRHLAPHGVYTNPAYLGLPLLAIVADYGWRRRRMPEARMAVCSFVVLSLFALGPRLHIHGIEYFSLPGKLLLLLPLVNKALPGRFMMYSSLAMGIVVSLWFGTNGFSRKINAAVAVALVIVTLPSLSFPWALAANTPSFFTTGIYRKYLKRDENVLVLPFGGQGNCDLWLAETNMYYRMVGGWTGMYPAAFDDWPFFWTLAWPTYLPDANAQLGAFLEHFQVGAAIVADSDFDARSWAALFSGYSSTIKDIGGVTVYRIRPSAVAAYRQVSGSQMRQRAAIDAVDSLVMASDGWLSAHRDFKEFDPGKALAAGFLKQSWCVGPTIDMITGKRKNYLNAAHHWFCGIEIGGMTNGDLMLGLAGSYTNFPLFANVEPAIMRYRNAALRIFFPFPHDLLMPGTPLAAPSQKSPLIFEFTPAQISATAKQLRAMHSPYAADPTTAARK
ncbi:MAG: hypothetical protein ACREQI_07005 [Candidatus Binataceae bacterium]